MKKGAKTANPLIVTYKGEKYTLEFTRATVEATENQRFDISDAIKFPVTGIPTLFYYAFAANHKGIKRKLVSEIFDNIGGSKAELFERLVELYQEPVMTLLEDNEEDEKNAVWE